MKNQNGKMVIDDKNKMHKLIVTIRKTFSLCISILFNL